MTESLRALLGGAIDYAGMFPPAGLPLEQALAKYRQHRAGPEVWMVGRFVCPAGRLGELSSTFSPQRDGGISVIVPWHKADVTDVAVLAEALSWIRDFSICVCPVDTLEFRWQGDDLHATLADVSSQLEVGAIGEIITSPTRPAAMFFELPSTGSSPFEHRSQAADSSGQVAMNQQAQTVAAFNRLVNPLNYHAGFKLRCGGAGPSAVPSSVDVAAVICACRDAGVFWKATAGLHHPFRHIDPALGVPMHGFINLLTAAVMADVHRLDAERVQTILEDDDPWHFRFTNETLTWRELSATVPQITAARERGLRSFGSCSIDEPWHDLTVLGLL